MASKVTLKDLIKISESCYEIPRSFRHDMRVPARVFANEAMLADIFNDSALDQLANMTTLPGIQNYAYAMPDVHQGYGFPIGGVAATAIDEGGVISPGGIGYDINCGVRLLVSNVQADDIKKQLPTIAHALFNSVPSGVGRGGKIQLKLREFDQILEHGAQHMLAQGFGNETDIEHCEERGKLAGADPSLISSKAKQRGDDQLGTLGSGNHFLEVQKVAEIFDAQAAQTFGLHKGAVVIMIHCGSRGLGHQTCTDYVRTMVPKLTEWGIVLPDRELACAPFATPEGQKYFSAMAAASNFAWANRHMIGHAVRTVWQKALGKDAALTTMYDISHNIGKIETHLVHGREKRLMVHRKGATRAFGPGRLEVCEDYRSVGQPVLIPGTMGTSSYVLAGTSNGMEISLGSSCHGAGRRLSRSKAKETINGHTLRKHLEQMGIIIECDSVAGLAEEGPEAYKNVDTVVQVVANAGIARLVARVEPLAVIKGG